MLTTDIHVSLNPPAAPVVAVVSHEFWKSAGLALDTSMGNLRVNRITVPIVGVSSPGFHGTDLSSDLLSGRGENVTLTTLPASVDLDVRSVTDR